MCLGIKDGKTNPGQSHNLISSVKNMVWKCLVWPGCLETETDFLPLRALMSEDLPTLGWPIIPMVMYLLDGYWSSVSKMVSGWSVSWLDGVSSLLSLSDSSWLRRLDLEDFKILVPPALPNIDASSAAWAFLFLLLMIIV